MTDPPQSRLRAGSIGRVQRFGMVGLSGVVVLMAAVELFGVDYRIANLAGIAVGTVINFTAGEVWIFRSR